jgi:hypothetical protein
LSHSFKMHTNFENKSYNHVRWTAGFKSRWARGCRQRARTASTRDRSEERSWTEQQSERATSRGCRSAHRLTSTRKSSQQCDVLQNESHLADGEVERVCLWSPPVHERGDQRGVVVEPCQPLRMGNLNS